MASLTDPGRSHELPAQRSFSWSPITRQTPGFRAAPCTRIARPEPRRAQGLCERMLGCREAPARLPSGRRSPSTHGPSRSAVLRVLGRLGGPVLVIALTSLALSSLVLSARHQREESACSPPIPPTVLLGEVPSNNFVNPYRGGRLPASEAVDVALHLETLQAAAAPRRQRELAEVATSSRPRSSPGPRSRPTNWQRFGRSARRPASAGKLLVTGWRSDREG